MNAEEKNIYEEYLKIRPFRVQLRKEINKTLLTEGLISSYDTGKLRQELKKIIPHKIKSIRDSNLPDLLKKRKTDDEIFTLEVFLKAPLDNIEVKQVDKLLSLFGYTNSVEGFDKFSLQLEPKYPVDVNVFLREKGIDTLYHITQSKYLSKIQKIGLTPRESQTTFGHPGNRIYLLGLWDDEEHGYDEDENTIEDRLNITLEMLARNKKVSVPDMSILKIRLDDNFPLYLDDTITMMHSGVLGMFTTKNIPPSRISILD
jgi:hypothetical protein